MKVTDLRIGNIINNNNVVLEIRGDSVLCSGSSFSGMVTYEEHELKPIILTPEWLMNLGAKKEVLDAGSGIGLYDSYYIGNHELSRVFTNIWGIIGIDCKPMKYVHEFQNMYYALTKKELVWKS